MWGIKADFKLKTWGCFMDLWHTLFFLSFCSLCQRQSYPTLDDMIVVGVKNKMMESKCREIYEEVRSALGIVPFKSRNNVKKQSKTLGILWQSRFFLPHFRFICLFFHQNEADKYIFWHITEKIIIIFSSFWYNFQK